MTSSFSSHRVNTPIITRFPVDIECARNVFQNLLISGNDIMSITDVKSFLFTLVFSVVWCVCYTLAFCSILSIF